MRGFLTSSEGRTAPQREAKANLMNGLIDGYVYGGWEGGGDTCGNHKKNLSILCKALLSLVEMNSVKRNVLLAVDEQDWQNICLERLASIICASWAN